MRKRVEKWLRFLWRWFFPRKSGGYIIETCDDEPKSVRKGIVYLIGDPGNEWAASFVCPCGCGEIITLNLLRQAGRPTWRVQIGLGDVATLVPSVWRKVGCKSHFIIRDGETIWCGNEPRED